MQYLRHLKLDYEPIEKLGWRYMNLYYGQADLITCPAQSTKQSLTHWRLKPPIQVISNGITLKQFSNKRSKAIREQYRRPLLLFVGRLAHEKNITFLLRAFAVVVVHEPKTQLLIVGDGPQRAEVQSLIRLYGLQNNVHLLGMIPHNKLLASGLFGAADLFVTASITENQPTTILEAQANGLVVVGARARGIPDLVRNGVNGVTVPIRSPVLFANAIISLIDNPERRARMRANTLRMIREHDHRRILKQWLRTYRRVIRTHKRR
jgi:glycosyltransferase involved in cell wall biosynthesis